jgi:lipid II:glycine glycyltransferase (peptidoglycan interpeptide bridge formation enzyme)
MFNEEYFLDIGRNLSGRYVLYLAYLESKVIGGALVLSSDSVLGYHLSAVKTDYRKLGVANYLRYEVIRDNLGSAMKEINFGGGLSGNPDDSLLRFKKGFSSQVLPFYIGKYTAVETLYQEVAGLWGSMYPELTEKYENYHLKYRYSS